MYSEKSVYEAVKKAFMCMYPDLPEDRVYPRFRELNMEALAQGVQHQAETVVAYELEIASDRSDRYLGPELFVQKACLIFQVPIDHIPAKADTTFFRELWLLKDMTFVEISKVEVICQNEKERFRSIYRTVRYKVENEDWLRYDPEDIKESLEAISQSYTKRDRKFRYEV